MFMTEWMNIWIEWSTWTEFVSTCQAGCSYDGFNSRGGKDRQGDSVEISKTTGLVWVRMSCEYLGVIQFSSIWSAFSAASHSVFVTVPVLSSHQKQKMICSRKKHWGSSDFAAHVLFNWLPATFEVQLFEVQSKHMLCLLKYTYHEKRDWDDTTCFLVQFVPYSLSYLFHIYWTEQGIRSIP